MRQKRKDEENGGRIMENTNGKSGIQKAARGAQIAKGAARTAGGIASGNFVAVAQGVTEIFSLKVILIVLAVVLVVILLPVIIISSIPQMLFNWKTVDAEDIVERSRHADALVEYYEEEIDELEEDKGIKPNLYWLISIESARSKQKLEDISEREVKASVENSYGIDEETGEPYLKTPDEMMDDLGFTSEEKNWADLMYRTLNGQYTDPDGEYGDIGGLSDYEGVLLGKEGETKVTYYNQFDKRWASQMYGRSSTIGEAGCGPTALSIVISTLTGKNVDPPTMCAWSVKNGHRCEGDGSYHSLIPAGAEHYGLKVEKLGRSSARELEEHLSSGKLVVAIMSKGHFTAYGHFIVLRGITAEGKVLVADPASYKRSEQEWSMSIILNEARSDAAAGGPFWSISK